MNVFYLGYECEILCLGNNYQRIYFCTKNKSKKSFPILSNCLYDDDNQGNWSGNVGVIHSRSTPSAFLHAAAK